MLTNKHNNVLYTRVTNNLLRHCFEHKGGLTDGFTKRYNVNKLVYFEIFDFIEMAIAREKQIKGLSRAKKNSLINNFNPHWNELYNNGAILKSSFE
jgi:putative endonuclease